MRGFLSKSIGAGLILAASRLQGAEAGPVVIVADSRHLTGLTAWWVNIYNDSHVLFALLTIVTIPVVGAILGSVADLMMRRIGIDLRSRSLRED